MMQKETEWAVVGSDKKLNWQVDYEGKLLSHKTAYSIILFSSV